MLFRMFRVPQLIERGISFLDQQVDLLVHPDLLVIRLHHSLLTASIASADLSHSCAVMVICQHRGLPFICSDA